MSDDNEEIPDEWAEAMAEQLGDEGGDSGGEVLGDSDMSGMMDMADELMAGAAPAEFEEFGGGGAGGEVTVERMDMILDIPVSISLEVGRTQITIRNLLQLNQGSVVELDRLAGEALDVLVNGTLIAHGEVVVVNEKFGIRLTDVITPQERIKKLRH
jgi:flagellar motor switch protein FliN/FliY